MAVSGTKGVGKGPFGAFGTGNGIPEGTGAIRTVFGPQNGRQTAGSGQNRPDLAGRPDPAPVFRIPYSSDSLQPWLTIAGLWRAMAGLGASHGAP